MEDIIDIQKVKESEVQSSENPLQSDAVLSPYLVNYSTLNSSVVKFCQFEMSEPSDEESDHIDHSFEELLNVNSWESLEDECFVIPFNLRHDDTREIGLSFSELFETTRLEGFSELSECHSEDILCDDPVYEEDLAIKELDRVNAEEVCKFFEFESHLDGHLFDDVQYDPMDLMLSNPLNLMSFSIVDLMSSSRLDSMSSGHVDSMSSNLVNSMPYSSVDPTSPTSAKLLQEDDMTSDVLVDNPSPSNNNNDLEETSDDPYWTVLLDHPYPSLHFSHLSHKHSTTVPKPQKQNPRGRPRKRTFVNVTEQDQDERRAWNRVESVEGEGIKRIEEDGIKRVEEHDKRLVLNEKERGRRSNVKTLLTVLRGKLPDGSTKKLGQLKILQRSKNYIKSLESELEQLEEEKIRLCNYKRLLQKQQNLLREQCLLERQPPASKSRQNRKK